MSSWPEERCAPTGATIDKAGNAHDAPASPDIGLGGAWDASLAGVREQDQRVADVAYRRVTANVELCSDRASQTGLVLQTSLEVARVCVRRLRPRSI